MSFRNFFFAFLLLIVIFVSSCSVNNVKTDEENCRGDQFCLLDLFANQQQSEKCDQLSSVSETAPGPCSAAIGCSEIVPRNNCFESIGMAKNDLSLCQKSTEDTKWLCVAVVSKNASYCTQFNNTNSAPTFQMSDDCYLNYAWKTGDATACKLIPKLAKRVGCITFAYGNDYKQNPEACALLDQEIKEYAYDSRCEGVTEESSVEVLNQLGDLCLPTKEQIQEDYGCNRK